MSNDVVIRLPDCRRHIGDLLDRTFIEWNEEVWIVCRSAKDTPAIGIHIEKLIGMGVGAEYLHPHELVRPLRLVDAIFE